MALSWEELDALIDEALKTGPRAGPNSFTIPGRWDCVDDNGRPRVAEGFDPRGAVERDPGPPTDGPLVP